MFVYYLLHTAEEDTLLGFSDIPTGNLLLGKPLAPRSLEDFPWGPGAGVRQMLVPLGPGLTLRPLPPVHAFHSHRPPRHEPRTQARTGANRACPFPRLQSPVPGTPSRRDASAKTPRALEALVRLSSKHPGIGPDVSGLSRVSVSRASRRRAHGE